MSLDHLTRSPHGSLAVSGPPNLAGNFQPALWRFIGE